MTPRFDLTYGAQPWQRLDLFLPEGAVKGVIVYAHGGGFRKGDRKDPVVPRLIPSITARNLALVSVGYRLGAMLSDLPPAMQDTVVTMQRASRQAGLALSRNLYGAAFVAALWDVSAAIAALRQGQIDPRLAGLPVTLLGNSAGGIIALSLAHPPRVWAHRLHGPDAVFAVSAAMVQPWCIGAKGPPCRILIGRTDRIVPPDDARLAKIAADKSGADLQLIETGIAGHNAQLTALVQGCDPSGRPWMEALLALTPA